MSKLVHSAFVAAFVSAANAAVAAPLPGSLGASLSTSTSAGPIIAVGIDNVQLPSTGTLPARGATAADTAAAYGYTAHNFGAAIAIGPSTVPTLPDPPAAYSDIAYMDDAERLTLFALTLDSNQWDMFRSDAGIGLGDLSTETEVGLFRSFFRPGTMLATVNFQPNEAVSLPELLRGVAEDNVQSILSHDDIDNARLRLGVRPDVYLPIRSGVTVSGSITPADHSKPAYIGVHASDTPAAPTYLLVHTGRDERVPLPSSRPNVVETSALPSTGPWASKPLTIRPGETVADLMLTVRQTGGPEVYAEPWYEMRPILVAGKPGSIASVDAMNAIAYAVGGVFRKVGDVYVLVDDSTGDQARWIAWADYLRASGSAKGDTIKQARQSINSPRTLNDLSNLLSPIALTPDQQVSLHQDSSQYPDAAYFDFLSLSPEQQDYVRRAAARVNGLVQKDAIDPKGDIRLVLRPLLEAIMPTNGGQPGPDGLPHPGPTAEIDTGASLAQLFGPIEVVSSETPALPALKPSMAVFKRRGAILAPKDANAASDIVSAAQTLGLNELWTPVDKAADVDMFNNLTSTAKEYGIKVFAYVDTLDWGAGATPGLKDLTSTGPPPTTTDGPAFVGPEFADVKTGDLDRLHAALGCEAPGIVIGSTSPPGYRGIGPKVDVDVDAELGYNVAARQDFIRKAHADPIDLLPSIGEPFDAVQRAGRDRSLDAGLFKHWDLYRTEQSGALVKSMLGVVAKLPPPAPPILVERADPNGHLIFATPTQDAQAPIFEVAADDCVDAGKLALLLVEKHISADWGGFVLDLRHTDATHSLGALADPH